MDRPGSPARRRRRWWGARRASPSASRAGGAPRSDQPRIRLPPSRPTSRTRTEPMRHDAVVVDREAGRLPTPRAGRPPGSRRSSLPWAHRRVRRWSTSSWWAPGRTGWPRPSRARPPVGRCSCSRAPTPSAAARAAPSSPCPASSTTCARPCTRSRRCRRSSSPPTSLATGSSSCTRRSRSPTRSTTAAPGVLHRSLDRTVEGLGADGAAWSRHVGWTARRWDALAPAVLAPVAARAAPPPHMAGFGLRGRPARHRARRAPSPREEARGLLAGAAAHSLPPAVPTVHVGDGR